MITLINIVGMGIGFGIFLSFWSSIRFDNSFDRFHEDIDQMYILSVNISLEDSEYTSERIGGIFGTALPDLSPQILSACRISQPQEFEFGIGSREDTAAYPMKYFNVDEILAVDTSFLEFFSFRLLQGDPALAFSGKDHILITQSLAKRLYGDEDPMWKEVQIDSWNYYKVAGVLEDPPENSSFQFKALMGFHIMEYLDYEVDRARYNLYFTNLKIADEADIEALNHQVNGWVNDNFDLEIESRYFLSPLTDLHLYGESKGIIGFYMNLIMALGMLFISCVNYVNLSSAYYTTRIREIAIRKSMGANRRQLMVQFMGETYLLLFHAFYLGLFMAEHLVPSMNKLFEVQQDAYFGGLEFWLKVLVIFLVTGFLAGFYPALKITGFNPLGFLSAKVKIPVYRGSRSRKVMLVIQLTLSVMFILFSIFMTRQYVHMKEADLGFNRKDVLYIHTSGQLWQKYPLLKNELIQKHYVEGVSSSSDIPVLLSSGTVDWGERNVEQNKLAVTIDVSYDFLETFEIELVEGSFYREGNDSLNHQYIVVNKELINIIGWEDPVGRNFYMGGRDYDLLGVTANIEFFPFNLGVFEDRALIYRFVPVSDYIFIRLKEGFTNKQVEEVLDVFESYNPGYENIYDFVGNFRIEAMENGYGLMFIFILFSVLAIFIAAMGLIGLSVFHNNSRTKEVGIRKVMGAHTGIIMRLLLSDFLRLVLLSNLIAIPLSYLALSLILQVFAYRIELQAMVFVLVILFSILASMITVIYHALRTSLANPVDSLRDE